MAQHTDFTNRRTQRNAIRDPEWYELTEREREALADSENDGRDHYVTVWYPMWQDGAGTWNADELSDSEVGPFPTGQLAWLVAEATYPGYSEADHYSLARLAVAGRCLTTGLPVEECEHIPGPGANDLVKVEQRTPGRAPTWDNMLGPIEDGDLMKERAQ